MVEKTFLALGSGSLFLFTSVSHAVSLSLSPIKDNVIYEDASGSLSNALGVNLFAGVNGGGGGNRELRSLITFDVSGIPSGSIINSVSLNLTANARQGTAATVQTRVHRLLGDWGEGTSTPNDGGGGSGGNATVGDATWIHQFSATSLWDNPGGDFVENPSASLPVTSNLLYSWASSGLENDVQGFVNGDFDNFGWILIAEQDGRAKRFFSGQSGDVNSRPQLLIEYTPVPEPGTSSLLLAMSIPAVLKRRRN